MFQPKIRRVLVSTALVSALSLLPAHAAAPRSQRSQVRSERSVAVRLVTPIRDFVNGILAKVSVRIDPNGNRVTINAEPQGNEPNGQSDRNR